MKFKLYQLMVVMLLVAIVAGLYGRHRELERSRAAKRQADLTAAKLENERLTRSTIRRPAYWPAWKAAAEKAGTPTDAPAQR